MVLHHYPGRGAARRRLNHSRKPKAPYIRTEGGHGYGAEWAHDLTILTLVEILEKEGDAFRAGKLMDKIDDLIAQKKARISPGR